MQNHIYYSSIPHRHTILILYAVPATSTVHRHRRSCGSGKRISITQAYRTVPYRRGQSFIRGRHSHQHHPSIFHFKQLFIVIAVLLLPSTFPNPSSSITFPTMMRQATLAVARRRITAVNAIQRVAAARATAVSTQQQQTKRWQSSSTKRGLATATDAVKPPSPYDGGLLVLAFHHACMPRLSEARKGIAMDS